MNFKDDVDWNHIMSVSPVWDEEAQDYYAPLTGPEMELVEKACACALGFRFRERPELPIEMQREQDRAFQFHVKKQFAYLKLGD